MKKVLYKSTSLSDAKGLENLLADIPITSFVQDFSDKDVILDDLDYCVLAIDFENQEEIKLAESFIVQNRHIKFCAYVNKGGRDAIINAHRLGCTKLVSKTEDLRALLATSEPSPLVYPHLNAEPLDQFKGAKILIVDDVEVNVNLLAEILASFEFEIYKYIDPVLAAKAIECEKFDIIFLDIVMPKISGFDMARIIRNSETNAASPIIFVSGHGEASNKVEGFHTGTAVFIEKPLEPATVRAQVYGLLKIGHLRSEITKQKENFMAMLTHDLKTPIRAQISALSLLLEGSFGTLSDFQREILNEIMASNKYMQNMTDNVLLKYKSENGRLQIQKGKHNIKDTIESAVSKLKYVISQKAQTIKVTYNLTCDWAYYDEIEIERVLTNLIVNAVEYSPENSEILVDVRNVGDEISVSVEDSGCGVEEGEIEIMFNKYTSRAKEYKKIGTGLGLYICKKIIAGHGGEIKAKRLKERGSRFTFTLSGNLGSENNVSIV